jgi:branched-chain amino acid transport system ATP-binding protein
LEKKNKILNIEKIHTFYGESHVIQGLSLHVDESEAVSILGRNGVGKTTTLRSVMGLTPPRSGSIAIDGKDTTKLAAHQVSKLGVAYVPAERHIFPGLNVEENLKLAARPGKSDDSWTLEMIYDQFPILSERLKQDGATLSGGEQQMLAIGRALISNPKIIILDEPSQGLSPLLVDAVTECIQNFCLNSGITLLVVEQNYRMALKVASRHYLMGTKGQIVGMATTAELKEDPQIIQDHLSV